MGKINRARFQNVSPQGKVSSPLINPLQFINRLMDTEKRVQQWKSDCISAECRSDI